MRIASFPSPVFVVLALFSISTCTRAEADSEDDIAAAFATADSLADIGLETEAGEVLLAAGQQATSPETVFQAANYFASSGALESAVAAVSAAGQLGFSDPIFLTNPAFNPVREFPGWIAAEARIEQNYEESGINAELYEIFRVDQDDRLYSGDPIEQIEERDLPRIARVKEIFSEGAADHPHDLLHAAMVLHHSSVPDDNLLAAQIADSARTVDSPHPMAAWLSGAAMDRYLSRIGEPQWYGTQMMTVEGVMVLDPATVDTSAVTPEERAERNAPSLERLRELMALYDSLVGES